MTHVHRATLAVGDLLDILPDAVVMIDECARIVYSNPAVHGLLGYLPHELQGQPLAILLPPAMRDKHEAMVERFRRGGQPMMMTQRPVLHALHRSGRPVAVSISLCNLAIEGDQWISVAVIHEVASLHTHLDRATQAAETDALTGVGNRLHLSRRLQAMLQAERPFALLYLDLNAFKPLNDRLRRAAGDEVLRIVARRLRGDVRDNDVVVHVGGDDFVVLIDALQDPAALAGRAAVLARRLAQPLRLEGLDPAVPIALSASMGGAISPLHGRTEQELLAAADRAKHLARQQREPYLLAAV